jgi:hypothetical protein
VMNAAAAAPTSTSASGELASEQGERTEPRRGRRGRRRGRRGGGGASRSMGPSEPGSSNAPPREESRPQPTDAGGNGAPPTEEVHVEPRESVAHFEPSTPAAAASSGQPARPFVVWSSGPADKPPGEDRGPHE